MLSLAQPHDEPLGGIDIFHLRTDDELRAFNGERNTCAIVAELDGRVDIPRLVERLEEGPDALRWRLFRTPRAPYCWRKDAPPPVPKVTALGDRSPLEGAVAALGEPATDRSPVRVVVLRGHERDAIVLVWFHAVTDARGATRLLSWLGGDDPVPDEPFLTSDRLLGKYDAAARRELTQGYIEHAFTLGERPILSLKRAAGHDAGPQRALRWRLSAEETERFASGLRARAGLADTSVVLWAACRLLDRLMLARGYSPPRQVVPVPVSLDPKRGCRRLFGNHLSMMLLSLERHELDDERRAIQSLALQRRQIIRDKLDVGMIAAMRATAWMPWRLVDHLSRRPFDGERSSFVLSNPGDLTLTSLFGVPVRDAIAVPTVLPSPGLMVTSDGFDGRRSLLFMYREGLVSEAELRAQLPRFKADLLGS